MVLPLIVGLLGFGVLGGFTLFAIQEILFWGSILAGVFIAFRTLQYLLDERPVELVEDPTAQNIVYLIGSGLVGLAGFKIVQQAFIAFGGIAAILVGVFLVAGYFIGFTTLIAYTVALFKEVNKVVNEKQKNQRL